MSDTLVSTAFFSVVLTLGAYAIGTVMQKRIPLSLCNPLLIATILVILVLKLTGIGHADYYKDTSWISTLLGPTIVALAIPLERQFRLLKRSSMAILTGIVAGTLACLASVIVLSIVLGLPRELLLSLLPKSITTAIGIDISAKIGGVPSLTSAAIAVTGIGGAVIAKPLSRIMRIHEPVAQGLALGTSAHAMGTSKAIEISELTGAISSLAIVLAGLLTAVLIPILVKFLN